MIHSTNDAAEKLGIALFCKTAGLINDDRFKAAAEGLMKEAAEVPLGFFGAIGDTMRRPFRGIGEALLNRGNRLHTQALRSAGGNAAYHDAGGAYSWLGDKFMRLGLGSQRSALGANFGALEGKAKNTLTAADYHEAMARSRAGSGQGVSGSVNGRGVINDPALAGSTTPYVINVSPNGAVVSREGRTISPGTAALAGLAAGGVGAAYIGSRIAAAGMPQMAMPMPMMMPMPMVYQQRRGIF